MTVLDDHPAPARPAAPATSTGRVTQTRVVRSEWIKFWTLRSSWVTLLAAAVGMIGIGVLVSALTNSHWTKMDPIERALFDPTARSLTGVYLAQLAVGVLGVLIISGEYATGMIRATLAAVPRRLPVLWAKLAVFSAVVLVLSLASSFASFLLGQQALGTHSTTLSAPEVLRSVVGAGLYLTVVGALAMGIGFLLRNTAGGIATVFGLLLVLPAIGHVLPSSWQHSVLPYLPSNAGGALYAVRPDSFTLSPWVGFAVECAWAAAAVVGAAVLLRRRDA